MNDYESLHDVVLEALFDFLYERDSKRINKLIRSYGFSDVIFRGPTNCLTYSKGKSTICNVEFKTPDGIKTVEVTLKLKRDR